MKIAAAGGGTERDSVLIDKYFAKWITGGGTLLYLPIALGWPSGDYEKATQWLRSVLEPLGIRKIETWTDLDDHRAEELDAVAALYIGGGNTYGLLQQLRRSGFDAAIRQFALGGRPVYGGSAGAAILGRDIDTVRHLDENVVQISDTTGLDLLSGMSVWVHYRQAEKEMVESFVSRSSGGIVVLSEQAAVVFDGVEFRSMGFESAYLVDRAGWKELVQ